MKQKLLLFAFTLLSAMLRSQSGTPSVPMAFKDWETNAGTQTIVQKNIVKTDASGNVYCAGASINATNGSYDILLTKTSKAGTLLYTKQINGSANTHDFALGLAFYGTDVYITGTITNNTVTLVPELFLAKYNSAGTQQFFTTYSNGYSDIGKDLVVNATYSTCIVTGASYNSNYTSDMVVVAFNMNTGAQNWVNFYDHAGLNDGGFKVTTRNALCTVSIPVTTSANNYKLATRSYSVNNGWASGSVVTGATATSSVEIVSDLVTDAAGNMYLCGATQQNAGQGYNMYIAKITSSLTIVWERTINGFTGSSLDDFARGIKVDASSNVYVTGVTTHSTQGKNITTIKLNSSGVVQWTKNINGSFNGNDFGTDLAIDASSNVYITGYKTISAGNTDIYSAKLAASTGNIIWEIANESELNDEGTNLVLDNNDVIVAGSREVTTGVFEYVTYKYVQKDIITPTDFSAETPKNNFMFFPNKGQLLKSNDSLASDVKFYTHQTYPSFFFKDKIQSYVFSRIDTTTTTTDTLHRIDLTFNSVNESAKTYSTDQQETGFLNYYLKHTGDKGIKRVKGNYRLVTSNLYNNIDLMTTSNQNGVKYYFIVKPGADMRDIKMEFIGASSFSLNGTSNALSINSSIGSLTFDKPIAYQLTAANATVAVTSFSPTWVTNGASNKYIFNNGAYTSSLTLIIEVIQKPINVTSAASTPEWGTFYGGAVGAATSHDIVTDVNGNLYSAGYMSGAPFPFTTGGIYANYKGAVDAFLSKFNNNYALRFTTLYGGNGLDKGFGVTYSSQNGKIYMCGATADTTAIVLKLSGSANSYRNNISGQDKCFITRHDTAFGYLEWATKFGSASTSYGKRIKADAIGNIYVIGDVYLGMSTITTCASNNSGAFPLCNPGGGAFYQGGFNSNVLNPNSSSYTDGYIARFNSQTELTASTLFGGEGDDLMNGITIDNVNQKLYVVGYTKSLNPTPNCTPTSSKFPLCNTAGGNYYQDRLNQNNTDVKSDGFISRFSLTTLALEWSTFFGGSDEDAVTDAVADPSGNLYVTGYTKSLTNSNNPCSVPNNGGFPTCPTNAPGGVYDAFITKFKLPGELVWSKFVGGTGNEVLVSGNTTNPRIAINSINNNIYISGNTRSCNTFPTINGISGSYIQSNHSDSICAIIPTNTPTDAYVSVYSNAGVLQNSTYFGGRGSILNTFGAIGEAASGLATYQHKVFISGSTYSSTRFPFNQPATTNPYYNTTYGAVGSNKVFYAQLNSTAVGIHEFDKDKTNFGSLTVFPNPTSGKINFEWDNTTSKKAEITVYNLMGQMVGSTTINEIKGLNKQEINLSDLTFGLYLVVIKTEIQTLNAKFIKE